MKFIWSGRMRKMAFEWPLERAAAAAHEILIAFQIEIFNLPTRKSVDLFRRRRNFFKRNDEIFTSKIEDHPHTK